MSKKVQLNKKRVALLVNLGTPDTPSIKSVRRYLFEFLMDEHVINKAYPLRLLLVGGIIAPFRAPQSSKSYQEIWDEKLGSPLLSISKKLLKAVEKKSRHPVFLAMRYGNPSIRQELHKAMEALGGEGEIFCIPLYPHYAMSTTKSVMKKVEQEYQKIVGKNPLFRNISLSFQPPFYRDNDYLKALAHNLKPLAEKTKNKKNSPEKIIFSYHGLPVNHIKATDPSKKHCFQVKNCCSAKNKEAEMYCYRRQCFETTQMMIKKLKLDPKKVMTTFQSRLGREPWLEPYTDKVLEKLAKDKVKHVAICAPAFVSDNLETLFELKIEGKEIFQEHGGKTLKVIPCLNTDDLWVKTIANWINKKNLEKK